MTGSLSTCAVADPTSQHKLTECKFFRTVKPGSEGSGKVEPFTHPEVSDNEYGIKHIKEKLPIGIALSGGGFRAATCAVGFMRGIHKTELEDGETLLSKVQYLSSTSGGSWFNAAFSYKKPGEEQQLDLDTFLGPYLEAQKLTPHVLEAKFPEGCLSFDSAIAKRSALDYIFWKQIKQPGWQLANWGSAVLDWVAQREHTDPQWMKPWTSAVANSFLAPYGLDVFENSTVSADKTKGGIHERATRAATSVLLACSDIHRPYPILTGTVCNATTDDGWPTYPLEFTPLYIGTAAAFPDSNPPLGGGFVEPWGLNAEPLQLECDDNGCTGTVQLQFRHPVPLAQAVAVSSGFLASWTHDKNDVLKGLCSTEDLVTWGVLEGEKGAAPEHKELGYADGGSLDNYAIMPLLRRGVKCLIVLVSASTPPDDTWQRFRDECSDIAALFGAANTDSMTPGITAGMLNDMCHVFGKDGLEGEQHFRRLFQDLHEKLRKGQPGLHCASYTVRENEFFHIPARDEPVEVLWIFNQQFAGWEAKLPADTYDRLQKEREYAIHHKGAMMEREKFPAQDELEQWSSGDTFRQTKLDRFPYFTTFSLDWGEAPVRLLSQMHTAIVLDPAVQTAIKGLVTLAEAEQAERARKRDAESPTSDNNSSSVVDGAKPSPSTSSRPATPEQHSEAATAAL